MYFIIISKIQVNTNLLVTPNRLLSRCVFFLHSFLSSVQYVQQFCEWVFQGNRECTQIMTVMSRIDYYWFLEYMYILTDSICTNRNPKLQRTVLVAVFRLKNVHILISLILSCHKFVGRIGDPLYFLLPVYSHWNFPLKTFSNKSYIFNGLLLIIMVFFLWTFSMLKYLWTEALWLRAYFHRIILY